MKPLLAIAACAVLASACLSAVGQAVLNSAVGVGVAAASRAGGGCYASCPPGTTCNAKTGFCDELPCYGQCVQGERCETRGLLPHCVHDGPELRIEGPVPASGSAPKATTP